jgi:hypothetical protein
MLSLASFSRTLNFLAGFAKAREAKQTVGHIRTRSIV